jgi:Tol biopolymer transport system component
VNFARWAAGGDAPARKGQARSKGGGATDRHAKGRAPARRRWQFRPGRWAAVLSLVALLGWLAYWGAAPALERLSAVGTVVFVSSHEGNPELYALSLGHGAPVRLTHDPAGRNTRPLWSPDGRALAFVNDPDGVEGPARPEVFVASADGRRVVDVSQSEAAGDAQPAWSPGSTRLAFVSDRDGRDRVYTVMADGTALAPLTAGAAAESSPAWSPDGQRVAWVAEGEVWVAAADGSAPRALTRAANDPLRPTYAEPTWSPDSSRLAALRSIQHGASRALELAVIEGDGSVAAATPAEPGGVAWLDRDRMVFLTRPAAGRSWFTIQRYSGAPQVCLRSVRRATQAWLRPLDTLTAGAFGLISKAPAVDSTLTVLTDGGADALVWAPGSAQSVRVQ